MRGRDRITSGSPLLQTNQRPPILDVGCGPGRHLIGLQKRGTVVGLDISANVLDVCRKRGGRLLILGSLARLPFKDGTFGTALMMSNGLGLTGDVEMTQRGLGEVHRSLEDQGLVVAHTSDPLDPESGVHEEYRSSNLSRGRPPGLLRIRVVYGGITGRWFELMLMPRSEAVSILKGSGFTLARSIEWDSSVILTARKTPHRKGNRLLGRLTRLIR